MNTLRFSIVPRTLAALAAGLLWLLAAVSAGAGEITGQATILN